MGANDINISSLNKVAFMPVGNSRNELDLRLIKDKKLLQTVFSELFDYDFNKNLDDAERTKIRNTIGSNILTPKKLEELNSKLEEIISYINELGDESLEKRRTAVYKLQNMGPIVKTPLRRRIKSIKKTIEPMMKAMEQAAQMDNRTKMIVIPSTSKLVLRCLQEEKSAKWVLTNIKPNK